MTHVMVEGTSEPQDFALYSDGAALDGTGFTVEIQWRSEPSGGPPTVDWLSQAGGTVRVSDTENMPEGAHYFRWKLTDGSGNIGYVPNLDKAPNVWRVHRVA
jgi:flagellar hook assembly protein FlgD